MTPNILNPKVVAWNALVNLGIEVAVDQAATKIAPQLENDKMKVQLGFALGALAAIISRYGAKRLADGE